MHEWLHLSMDWGSFEQIGELQCSMSRHINMNFSISKMSADVAALILLIFNHENITSKLRQKLTQASTR